MTARCSSDSYKTFEQWAGSEPTASHRVSRDTACALDPDPTTVRLSRPNGSVSNAAEREVSCRLTCLAVAVAAVVCSG